MTIIGIGHQARVGKDVAASALTRDLGFVRVGFADKLKELALSSDPIVTSSAMTTNVGAGRGRFTWAVSGLGWDEAKALYPEVRGYLQRLGTAARDVFGPDFWIDQVFAGIGDDEDVVISDVRYRNEAERIQEEGGIVIKIHRPGVAGVHHADHASEKDLADWDGWDAVVVNNSDVQSLQAEVVRTVKEWL